MKYGGEEGTERFSVAYTESKSRDLIECLGSEHETAGGVTSEQ
jgi:hypothetical protein